MSWPTSWTCDAPIQSSYIISNEAIRAWHPVLHTLWMTIPLKLSYALFGSYSAGAAFYGLTQALLLVTIYSYIAHLILKWKIPTPVFALILGFICLYPGIAKWVTLSTKDIAFSAFFALAITLFLDSLIRDYRPKHRYVSIWLCILAVLAFRNNAVYGFIIAIPFLIILFKNKRLFISCFCISLVLATATITGPLYSLMGITPTSIRETLNVPLAQLARVHNYANEELTDEQRAFIEDYVPYWGQYDPWLADTTKWGFPEKEFKNDPSDFFRKYVSIGIDYPEIYTDAFLQLNVGFFSPALTTNEDVVAKMNTKGTFAERSDEADYWINNNMLYIASDPLVPDAVLDSYNKFAQQQIELKIPGVASLFQTGTWLWFIVFYACACIYKKKWSYLAPAVVFLAYWLTLMLGPGVILRYALVACTCGPEFLAAFFVLLSGKPSPSQTQDQTGINNADTRLQEHLHSEKLSCPNQAYRTKVRLETDTS